MRRLVHREEEEPNKREKNATHTYAVCDRPHIRPSTRQNETTHSPTHAGTHLVDHHRARAPVWHHAREVVALGVPPDEARLAPEPQGQATPRRGRVGFPLDLCFRSWWWWLGGCLLVDGEREVGCSRNAPTLTTQRRPTHHINAHAVTCVRTPAAVAAACDEEEEEEAPPSSPEASSASVSSASSFPPVYCRGRRLI